VGPWKKRKNIDPYQRNEFLIPLFKLIFFPLGKRLLGEPECIVLKLYFLENKRASQNGALNEKFFLNG